MMDLQAGLQDAAGDAGRGRGLRTAAAAIRKDPREAARPENTVPVLRRGGQDVRPRQAAHGVSGKQIRNRKYNAGAVTGGFTDNQAGGKQGAFERALDNL